MKTIFVPMQLKCARKRKGQTLKDVSQGAGITISQLSDIEQGRTLPSIKTLLTLIDFYELPLGDVFVAFDDEDEVRI